MLRTHTCGELTKKQVGTTVTLAGWVHARRDHGGVIFIDLRDFYGLTQLRFDPTSSEAAWKTANGVRSEFVLQVSGKVIARPDDMVNDKLATGAIEVDCTDVTVLNASKTPPFEIDKNDEVNEELRYKHRYLDLRRTATKELIAFRSRYIRFIREFMGTKGFLEIETPLLTKSTPEGARDYLVPSRKHAGQFYALPQSPQQYKQMLMVGGIDKYFQIAPCMRDEDARFDRAAGEFYQLDIEMAFVEQEDVLALAEELFTSAVATLLPDKKIIRTPWPRLAYDEAMGLYGSDKPDIRYEMKLVDVTDLGHASDFEVMKSAPMIKGIVAQGFAPKASRAEMDKVVEEAKALSAKGLAWAKITKGAFDSQIAKFFPDELQKKIISAMGADEGDVMLFVADEERTVNEVLGGIRSSMADRLGLKDPNLLAFAFVVNWPLFEPEMEDGHYAPMHHMFTRPKDEDLPLLATDPFKARSWQHDMVINGLEIGGGSLRIHDAEVQHTVFKLVGLDPKKAKIDFLHMLEAFQYGAPPHGGIALGLDRSLIPLLNLTSVREATAFPKTGDGRDLTVGAPSVVEDKQLKELHIALRKE